MILSFSRYIDSFKIQKKKKLNVVFPRETHEFTYRAHPNPITFLCSNQSHSSKQNKHISRVGWSSFCWWFQYFFAIFWLCRISYDLIQVLYFHRTIFTIEVNIFSHIYWEQERKNYSLMFMCGTALEHLLLGWFPSGINKSNIFQTKKKLYWTLHRTAEIRSMARYEALFLRCFDKTNAL